MQSIPGRCDQASHRTDRIVRKQSLVDCFCFPFIRDVYPVAEQVEANAYAQRPDGGGRSSTSLHRIPSLEHESRGAVFVETTNFVGFEHTESFGRIVRPLHVGGIEYVAQLVAREAVGARVLGIELGSEL